MPRYLVPLRGYVVVEAEDKKKATKKAEAEIEHQSIGLLHIEFENIAEKSCTSSKPSILTLLRDANRPLQPIRT